MRNFENHATNIRQSRGTDTTYSYTEKDGSVILSAQTTRRARRIGVFNIATQTWDGIKGDVVMPHHMMRHIEHVYGAPMSSMT